MARVSAKFRSEVSARGITRERSAASLEVNAPGKHVMNERVWVSRDAGQTFFACESRT